MNVRAIFHYNIYIRMLAQAKSMNETNNHAA